MDNRVCVCVSVCVLGHVREVGCLEIGVARNWPEDTQSQKVKKTHAKANVQDGFEEQLARARAACASGTLAGTASLVAVAMERRKKNGVDTWVLVIRVGGKQKMSFNQNQAALGNFSIDDSVAAGNIVVTTLQRDGIDYLSGDVSVADMFNKALEAVRKRNEWKDT